MTRALWWLVVLGVSGCAVLGDGEGEVHSDALFAADCWSGRFDLLPDFFAAVPFRETLQIRVQRGSDLAEVSDGLQVLVNDVSGIREVDLGRPVGVGLPPQLLNAIAPGLAQGAAPPVSMSLYLQNSCHSQNVALHALSGSVTFDALFNGNPNEAVGSEKLTNATFDVLMADPRDAIPGTIDVPAAKTSRVSGRFKFHFQRGQPGQPFP
jgi:hypothetical protein